MCIRDRQNAWFMIYMQAFRIAMLFLMLCAMCRQFLQREAAPGAMYTLTFAGAVMFFMLWEAGKRYNICFTGVCLLLMADGADGFKMCIRDSCGTAQASFRRKHERNIPVML